LSVFPSPPLHRLRLLISNSDIYCVLSYSYRLLYPYPLYSAHSKGYS
jgi:hypothetical protein